MKKRILSTLLTLCMVLTLLPVTAQAAETSGTCGDNVTWSYSDGVLTIEGTGPMDDYLLMDGSRLPLPWAVDSREIREIHTVIIENGVTSIGAGMFWNNGNLTSVSIPDSVTSIGQAAFWCCRNLLEVTIPDSVTFIGQQAFEQCELLRSVTIPDGITNIWWGAFSGCVSLTSVTIPDSVTDIADYAFKHCISLTDVYYSGIESQWRQITIGENNEPLTNVAVHYSNAVPDTPAGSEQPVTPAEPEQPAVPGAPVPTSVVLSPQKLAVNGESVECEKYNIDGSNYFKLRDLAQLLNGTGSQFGVGFDAATSTVAITTGQAYESTGTELAAGVDNSATTQPSSQSILINGTAHGELTVYNIGGSNFFQLRELGSLLNFEVGYDVDTNTATVTSVQ